MILTVNLPLMNKAFSSEFSSLDRLIPFLLLVFAFWDLRLEVRLLLDHFTLTSLVFALKHHALAFLVLISCPSLFIRYGFLK